MFKVRRISDNKIYTVLSVYLDKELHLTYFLIWENMGWRWRPADKYLPPGVTIEEYREFLRKDVPF